MGGVLRSLKLYSQSCLLVPGSPRMQVSPQMNTILHRDKRVSQSAGLQRSGEVCWVLISDYVGVSSQSKKERRKTKRR